MSAALSAPSASAAGRTSEVAVFQPSASLRYRNTGSPRPEVDVLGKPEAHFREDGESLHELPEDVFILGRQSRCRCRGQAGGCLAATHSRLHREAEQFEGIWPSCTHKYTFRFSIAKSPGSLTLRVEAELAGYVPLGRDRCVRTAHLLLPRLQRTACGSMTEYT